MSASLIISLPFLLTGEKENHIIVIIDNNWQEPCCSSKDACVDTHAN